MAVLGAPVTAAMNGETVSYAYDGFGRVTRETAGDVVKTYGYDNNGNVTSIRITQNGRELYAMTYTYDALGQLSKAVAPDMTRNYTYNDNGALLTETDGTGTASYAYNAGGLLTGISGTISEQYTYALNGMKTAETAYDGAQKSYAYNGAGRLVTETVGANSKTYSYDKRGNRTALVEINNGTEKTTHYTYDLSNRLTKSSNGEEETSYYYDNAGNLYTRMTGYFTPNGGGQPAISLSDVAPEAASYRWNALGQQVSCTANGRTASYTYDAAGIRTSKTVDGVATELVNISGSVVAEIGRTTTAYYRANGKVLYAKTGTATTNYTYNGHGDVVRAGAQSYQYDAFGNQLTIDETDTNPFRYAGEYYDGETGNIYLRSRFYDPSVGRFTQEDPAREDINWYAFCGNNPINFVDSSGLGYKPIREVAAQYGLTVNWNPVANKAYIFVGNGVIEFYESFGGDGGGSFVQDGVMYVDEEFFSRQYEEMYTSYIADTSVDTVTDLGWVIDVAAVGSVFVAKGGAAVLASPKTVVLGSYPMYIQKAKEIGAQFFQIPMSLWEKLTSDQQWALNREFLDKAIAQSATFLVEARGAINENTFLYKEIQYLLEHGYQWLEDLSGLIKP